MDRGFLRQFTQAEAARLGVNPGWIPHILAIGQKESRYHPRIATRMKYVPRGGGGHRRYDAQGVFQFVPKTWRSVLGQHGAKFGYRPGATPETDWKANIRMGILHIADNLKKAQSYGMAPSLASAYWMHFLPALAPAFGKALKTNPNTRLDHLIMQSHLSPGMKRKIIARNRGLIYPGGKAQTVAGWMKSHGGGGPAQVAQTGGAGAAAVAAGGVPAHIKRNPYDPGAAARSATLAGETPFVPQSQSDAALKQASDAALAAKAQVGGQSKVSSMKTGDGAGLALAMSGQSKVPSYVSAMMADALKGPVNHPVDALGRIAQFGAGAWVQKKHRDQEGERKAALINALTGGKLTPEAALMSGDPSLKTWGMLKIQEKRQAAAAVAARTESDRKAARDHGYRKELAGMRKPLVTIQGSQQTEMGKAFGKKMAGRLDTAIKGIDEGRDTIAYISQMEKLGSQIYSGAMADQKLSLARLGQSIGIKVDDKAVAASEAYRLLAQKFLEQRFAATKGAITEREVALFQRSIPQLATSPEGRKMMLSIMRGMAERKIAYGQEMEKWYGAKKSLSGFNEYWSKKYPGGYNALKKQLSSYAPDYRAKPAQRDGQIRGPDGKPKIVPKKRDSSGWGVERVE